MSDISVSWLGVVDYDSATVLQRSIVEAKQSGRFPNSILMLEHPHTVTLGRRSDRTHVITDEKELTRMGGRIYDTDRGGEATYHGPGQLVLYPIIDLKSVDLTPVSYVRLLERSIISFLSELGVRAHTVAGETGVWVDGEPVEEKRPDVNPKGRKIAAIGVRITRGVTMHGLALNISSDTSYYQHIIPCGMPNLSVTSLEKEIGQVSEVKVCATNLAQSLAKELGQTINVCPDIYQLLNDS